MSRTVLAATAAAFLILSGCGGGGSEEAAARVDPAELEAVFQQAMQDHAEAETPEAKLAVIKSFLEMYPDSKYTGDAIEGAIYYLAEPLGDLEGAIAYAVEIRGKVTDPKVALEIDKKLLDLYADQGKADEFRALADKISSEADLSFTDHLAILNSSVKFKAWDLVQAFCAAARPQANAETFKSDYPDIENYSEEQFEAAGRNREALILGYEGWAKANTGKVDEALADSISTPGGV